MGPEPSPAPPAATAATAATEDERLAGFVDVLAALASGDFARRARVVGDGSVLDGVGVGLNMLAEELAERVSREAALQRRLVRAAQLAAVGQLAAGIAHEINNPAAFLLTNLSVVGEYVETIEALFRRLRAELAEDARARDVFEAALSETSAERALRELNEIASENATGVQRIASTVQALLGIAQRDGDRRADPGVDAAVVAVGALADVAEAPGIGLAPAPRLDEG